MTARSKFSRTCTRWVRRAAAVLSLATGVIAPVPGAEAAGRQASMVIDANTGQVLHAQAADEPRYPASLTKMMTLYIVFELMEQGRLQPSTRIRISDEAAGTSPSKLGLAPDSEIALSDAIRALITKSANDIAVAIAEHIAGTEPKFAALMTRKAHQLGMTATTFRNAHGLPDSGQTTTARDMLTLALRLNDDFPRQYQLFSLRSFSYQGKTYANHNTMLGYYQGMDGLKTGYTTQSGFNLVVSVRRNGRHVVAAVFGGNTASARNVLMRALLDRSLPKASTEKTRAPAAIARVNRPEKQQVAFRTTSEDAPQPALVEPVRQAEKARLAEARAEASASGAGVPVQMARVRPVVMAPRQAPQAAELKPASQSSAASQFAAEPAGSVAPQSVAFNTPAQAVAPPAAVVRGAAPSSLQAQAQRLDRGASPVAVVSAPAGFAASPAPAPRPRGPAIPAKVASAGGAAVTAGVALQVGAYATEAEAQRQLAVVRERSAGTLASAGTSTQSVQAGGRQLYRARFVGLDPAIATSTCTELRRAQIDCHVAPMR